MTKSPANTTLPDLSAHILAETSRKKTKAIHIVPAGTEVKDLDQATKEQKKWASAHGFAAAHGEHIALPGEDGDIDQLLFALAEEDSSWPRTMAYGALAKNIADGNFHLEGEEDENSALLFWLLGAYRFEDYKSQKTEREACLKLPKSEDNETTIAIAQAIWFGRNLINTPAENLGPEELQEAVKALGKQHKARVTSVVGDDLLTKNFPLIHTVGRASDRAPRLIDLTWGDKKAPKVTLVGKGICFDTGGLNLKPGNAMLLMKKDMGGSAAAIALAHMIMSANLPVRLRLLIASADNNVSANAFRPGDVYTARNGETVEIANTDAEGRLVLADALSLADEDEPDYLFDFATLTGAARVALGPDLPPFYTENDELAQQIETHGKQIGDPLWRLPLWAPYERMLSAATADVNHCGDTPFAGSITAALFLKRFVKDAKNYAHFDIYGWNPTSLPAKPKGGEPQAARAVFATLQDIFT